MVNQFNSKYCKLIFWRSICIFKNLDFHETFLLFLAALMNVSKIYWKRRYRLLIEKVFHPFVKWLTKKWLKKHLRISDDDGKQKVWNMKKARNNPLGGVKSMIWYSRAVSIFKGANLQRGSSNKYCLFLLFSCFVKF